MATKRGKAGAVSSSMKAAASQRAKAQRAPSKYDSLTVYDPTTKEVVGTDGARRSARNMAPMLAELSEMPGPLAVLDRLYICETADEQTIAQLAKLAGCRISTLESKRLDYVSKEGVDCPKVTPMNRRRCLMCPRWKETNETPF